MTHPKHPAPTTGTAPASSRDYLQAIPQYLYPQHLLSTLMWRAARIRSPWIKDRLIRWFIRTYRVDMGEAANPDPTAYASFNHFFTRALHPDARVSSNIAAPSAGAVLSPADGRISQFGPIDRGRILQAKGREYSTAELLQGNTTDSAPFLGGQFMTIYLSPRDYHRVHMPVAGRLREMRYVPGRLFSVNAGTTRVIPRLFARNERVIFRFDTQIGPMALVMVGAIFVGSIDTVWAGTITPSRRRAIHAWRYGDEQQTEFSFQRGQEIGRFNMGSTVILLLPPDSVTWAPPLHPGMPIKMGTVMGSRR
uniref:Phosphatidylserine decarboxylase proenzyme n=1 Tax=Candidatus Kentrum sp. FM TaxID=2126340 RepID=A0A450SCU6_9GAMM|nr:MAG: phosphatidylserine decarboxylase [Candidatus Kentron sp. FM]VFJ75687.1 MAG: phosphatidylserine decarboxylase [Candidatus Kentron sp. FM]VFK22363.1 MAG: phosphatidylserine decarboxylase [Candidatus Kentron sp. FM]